MARTRLTAVGEEEVPTLLGATEETPPMEPRSAERAQSALTSLLVTSLRALSQRTIVALASLVDLSLIGSAFALWLMIIGQPSTPQLIGVAGYAVFVLAAIMLRRR
jgi:hypothetical protein